MFSTTFPGKSQGAAYPPSTGARGDLSSVFQPVESRHFDHAVYPVAS